MRERNTKNIYTKIEKMESEMYHEEGCPKRERTSKLDSKSRRRKMRVSILKSSFLGFAFAALRVRESSKNIPEFGNYE